MMKRKINLSLLLITLLMSSAALADSIRFKDGRVLHGRFVEEKGNHIVFQKEGESPKLIAVELIEEVTIGLSGLKGCFTPLGASADTRNCQILLRGWKNDVLLYTPAPDYQEEKSLYQKDIAEVEVWIESERNLTDFLNLNQTVGTVKLYNGIVVEGAIKQVGSSLIVETPGGPMKLSGDSIAWVKFRPRQNPPIEPPTIAQDDRQRFHPLYIVPGYYNIKHDRPYRGYTQFGMATIGGLTSLFYYNKARLASVAGQSDPTTFLFYNTSHRQAFNQAQRNMKLAGGVALAAFAWSTFDWIYGEYFGGSKETVSTGPTMSIEITPVLLSHHENAQSQMSVALQFRF